MVLFSVALLLLLFTSVAAAQEKVTEYVPDSDISKTGKIQGWDGMG